jgi:LysM repeat protein
MKRNRWLSLALAGLLALVGALPVAAQGCASNYTVKAGDNLYRIGLANNIPWTRIAEANHLTNANLIFVGQVLCIPAPVTPGPSATPGPSPTPKPSSTPAPLPTSGPTAVPTTTVPITNVPTIVVITIVRGVSITVQTAYFPPNQVFDVSMGPIGALGIGYSAGTLNSGAGGVFTATVPIPAPLANANQISVRVQNAAGYYSYGWFYNADYP